MLNNPAKSVIGLTDIILMKSYCKRYYTDPIKNWVNFTIVNFDTHKFDPTCIYLPKVKNRNKIRCDICSKLNRETRTER